MFRKSVALFFLLIFTLPLLFGCGNNSSSGIAAKGDKTHPVKVGVTAGPHAELMEAVKKEAEKQGITIQIVEFNDYVQPNIALSQGDLDMNSFQHQPYLDNMVKDRHLDIVSIGKTVIFPMGLYSKKYKSLQELPDGATLALPNDPTNGGRALLLFAKAGFITLKDGVGIHASLADIATNPKNFKFTELDAAQIPLSLNDMTLAATNTNYAMTAGMVPARDALLLEDGNSPYANVLAVRTKDKDNPLYIKIAEIYRSPAIKQYVQEHFQGSVIPCW